MLAFILPEVKVKQLYCHYTVHHVRQNCMYNNDQKCWLKLNLQAKMMMAFMVPDNTTVCTAPFETLQRLVLPNAYW